MKAAILRSSILAIIAASVISCVSTPSSQMRSATRSESAAFAEAPQDRPGLGTQWGETRESRVVGTQFERADPDTPLAVAAINYNDAAGIRAMVGGAIWQRAWPALARQTGTLISLGLRDQSGQFLPGLIVGDRWFVVGEAGRRYSIVLRNRTDLRLEIVLSVDGLDVLDGKRLRSENMATSLDPIATWSWMVFAKAPKQSQRFVSVPCANHMRTKNTATRATSA